MMFLHLGMSGNFSYKPGALEAEEFSPSPWCLIARLLLRNISWFLFIRRPWATV